jgi:hypothetical protein
MREMRKHRKRKERPGKKETRKKKERRKRSPAVLVPDPNIAAALPTPLSSTDHRTQAISRIPPPAILQSKQAITTQAPPLLSLLSA